MQEGSADNETVNAVFRAVHSIKGGAGAFKLDRLVKFAHVFETTLDKIRTGQLAPSPAVMKTMLRAADVLADLVTVSRDGGDFRRQSLQRTDRRAQRAQRGAAGRAASAGRGARRQSVRRARLGAGHARDRAGRSSEYVIGFRPKPELYAKGNETTRLMRELARLGSLSVHCEIADVPLLANLEPEQSYLSWRATLRSDQDLAAVQAVFEFVDGDCHLDIEAVDTAHLQEPRRWRRRPRSRPKRRRPIRSARRRSRGRDAGAAEGRRARRRKPARRAKPAKAEAGGATPRRTRSASISTASTA